MLNRNLIITGIRTEHVVRAPSLYQFITVYNHSQHTLSFFPENDTSPTRLMYRVPPLLYLTLPLFEGGQTASCQKENMYTVISEGPEILPIQITLSFTEISLNINLPFPDQSISPLDIEAPAGHSSFRSWNTASWPAAGVAIDFARTRHDRHQVLTSYQLIVTDAAVGTEDIILSITPSSPTHLSTFLWRDAIGAGSPRGAKISATGLSIPARFGELRFVIAPAVVGARFMFQANGFDYFPKVRPLT